jgi:hypothetical protein
MRTGPDALTAKEKEALRLLLHGHDAKSSARSLGLSVLAPAPVPTPAAAKSEAAAAADAAEAFLRLIDEGRWAESYAATGAEFRRLNTLKVWTDVSERVRLPLDLRQGRPADREPLVGVGGWCLACGGDRDRVKRGGRPAAKPQADVRRVRRAFAAGPLAELRAAALRQRLAASLLACPC